MPDTRSDLFTKNQAAQQEQLPVAGKQSMLRKYFPWLACVLVFSGNFLAAWRIDAEVATGRFTGLPYLALICLFAAIFAVYHRLNKDA